MILYEYRCAACEWVTEEFHSIQNRNYPETLACPRCSEWEVYRVPGCGGFEVPEGGCGNAKTGYASTHGDAENFKARDAGKPLPYGDDCKISEGRKG